MSCHLSPLVTHRLPLLVSDPPPGFPSPFPGSSPRRSARFDPRSSTSTTTADPPPWRGVSGAAKTVGHRRGPAWRAAGFIRAGRIRGGGGNTRGGGDGEEMAAAKPRIESNGHDRPVLIVPPSSPRREAGGTEVAEFACSARSSASAPASNPRVSGLGCADACDFAPVVPPIGRAINPVLSLACLLRPAPTGSSRRGVMAAATPEGGDAPRLGPNHQLDWRSPGFDQLRVPTGPPRLHPPPARRSCFRVRSSPDGLVRSPVSEWPPTPDHPRDDPFRIPALSRLARRADEAPTGSRRSSLCSPPIAAGGRSARVVGRGEPPRRVLIRTRNGPSTASSAPLVRTPPVVERRGDHPQRHARFPDHGP